MWNPHLLLLKIKTYLLLSFDFTQGFYFTISRKRIWIQKKKRGCKVPFHISNWKYCPTVSKTWVGTVLPILHINITYMHQTKIFEFRSYHMLYPYLQKNLFISWFNWLLIKKPNLYFGNVSISKILVVLSGHIHK